MAAQLLFSVAINAGGIWAVVQRSITVKLRLRTLDVWLRTPSLDRLAHLALQIILQTHLAD